MIMKKDLYMKVSSITGTDYEGKVMNDEEYYINEDSVIDMINDLIWERNCMEEKLNDDIEHEKNIREEYYKEKSPYELFGMNENDFF